MKALRHEPVDHIPFVPLIDWYTIMDMPVGLKNEVGANMAGANGYNRAM